MNTEDLIPLVYDDNDWVEFYMEIKGDVDSYMNFTIYKVTAWDFFSEKPVEITYQFDGRIKWDGTMTISTKDKYLYFSDRMDVKLHQEVLSRVIDTAKELIEDFEE